MKFTKTEVREIRDEMEKALEKIAKKYNATADIGRITFGSQITAKLTFSKIAEDQYGEYKLTKEAQELKRRLPQMGLREDVLNEPFIFKGETIIIKGYNTRARSYPIEYTKGSKNYKCTVDHMKTLIRDNRPELFL